MAERILDGRIAIVTGSGRGLGRAMALGLAAAGARVVVADVDGDVVGESVEAIRARSGRDSATGVTQDLTAEGAPEHRLDGWRHGLDGFAAGAPAQVYQGAHLFADFDAVVVAVDSQSIRLTRREFELLKCLVENRNRVLSRDRLLERVWGYDHYVETRSVDVHVGRLGSKLGAAGPQIETVVGLGYRFVE